jgi:hypothetical protein
MENGRHFFNFNTSHRFQFFQSFCANEQAQPRHEVASAGAVCWAVLDRAAGRIKIV